MASQEIVCPSFVTIATEVWQGNVLHARSI